MRRFLVTILSVLMLVTLTGCGGGSGEGVAYLCFDRADAFGGTLIGEAFEKAAQSKGLNVTYYDAKGDANLQVDQMKEAVANGVKSIVLLAADGDILAPEVVNANEKGITVITVNRGVNGGEHQMILKLENFKANIYQAHFLKAHRLFILKAKILKAVQENVGKVSKPPA